MKVELGMNVNGVLYLGSKRKIITHGNSNRNTHAVKRTPDLISSVGQESSYTSSRWEQKSAPREIAVMYM